MSRRNRRHAGARQLEDRGDHQRTPEAQRDVATSRSRAEVCAAIAPEFAVQDAPTTSPRQPTAVKVVLLFWGIPICFFILIYVLRHCVNLW